MIIRVTKLKMRRKRSYALYRRQVFIRMCNYLKY